MRRAALVVPVATVLVLAGCSVSPFNVLTDEQRSELRGTASEYQQLVLADLFVDETEYRQSVEDWHSCVGAAGAAASPIAQNGNQLSFDYTVEAPSDSAVDAIDTVADACLPEYYDAVGRVWVSQGTKLG